eukprot:3036986-Rhodomonas_salina.1
MPRDLRHSSDECPNLPPSPRPHVYSTPSAVTAAEWNNLQHSKPFSAPQIANGMRGTMGKCYPQLICTTLAGAGSILA